MVILKSIIDVKGNLLGYRLRGTEREFGGNTVAQIEINVPLEQVMKLNINNAQVTISNGRIIEKGNFKLRDLKSLLIKDNKCYPVDNTMEITLRVLEADRKTLVGYLLKVPSGEQIAARVPQIAKMSKWLKPVNFAVRFGENGIVIAGKPGGVSIEEMPTQYIGSTKKVEPVIKSEKQPTKIVSNDRVMDIIDFIDDVSSEHGFLVLPGGKDNAYNSTDASANSESNKQRLESGFKQLRVGEISSARFTYNPVTLNVNADFKKIGTVEVNDVNVPCYSTSKKTMFRAGVNNMKKIMAFVPSNNFDNFVRGLGKSVDRQVVTDELTSNIAKVAAVVGETNSAIKGIIVDASQLNTMTNSKIKSSILSEVEIASILGELFTNKIVAKTLNTRTGILKEVIKSFGSQMVAESTNRSIAKIYQKYDENMLNMMRTAGIDIYTGAYVFKHEDNKKSSQAITKVEHDIEIEYALEVRGVLLDINKFRVSDIAKDLKNVQNYVGVEQYYRALQVIQRVLNSANVQELTSEASRITRLAQSKIDELNYKLWLHNVAMTIQGETKYIHCDNSSDWIDDTNGRAKKYIQYVYNKNVEPDTVLRLKTLGVSVKR